MKKTFKIIVEVKVVHATNIEQVYKAFPEQEIIRVATSYEEACNEVASDIEIGFKKSMGNLVSALDQDMGLNLEFTLVNELPFDIHDMKSVLKAIESIDNPEVSTEIQRIVADLAVNNLLRDVGLN